MKKLATTAATAAAATNTGFLFKRAAEIAIGETGEGRIETGGAPHVVQYVSPLVV
jgi:hypothetical protein